MHFKEVTYKRNFRVSVVDQYLYETIETKVAFDEGEDAKLAFAMAKQFVLEQGSKIIQYPDHLSTEEKYIPEDQLPVIRYD